MMVLGHHHFSALKDEWIETSISNGCHYHKKEKQPNMSIPSDKGTQHCHSNTFVK